MTDSDERADMRLNEAEEAFVLERGLASSAGSSETQLARELARAREEIKRLAAIRRRSVLTGLAARKRRRELARRLKTIEAQAEMAIRKKSFDVVLGLMRRTAQLRGKRNRLAKLWGKLRARFRPDKANIARIKNSLFFDKDWYASTYADIGAGEIKAAWHYYAHGAREGRDPGPFFSTRGYLANNPHVAEAGVNPLLHYEKSGWREARVPFGDELTGLDRAAIRRHIADLAAKPLISVIMPVYNPPIAFLRQAIESVLDQSYENWELCIANDASTNPEVARTLDKLAAADERIKVIHREKNGNICAASNSALTLAAGEFVALMDHDDILEETALYEVAVEINDHPDVDVIYSDEDKISENGARNSPYFKPDFNPELLLGQNMVSHLGVYRRSLIERIGGFRLGFEGSQDYDLVLRAWAASSSDRIRHIPAILYHWRQGAQAPSFSESRLEQCTQAARRAVQELLDREGEGAVVAAAPNASSCSRIVRKIPEPKPLVSVIVPTRDHADLTAICADGVLNKTDYPNLELLIVDHDSKEPATRSLFERLKRDPRVTVLPYSGPFNFSAMNNMAAAVAKGSILALLNNDIEIISPDWLTEMVANAIRRDVGAVGAKLYYPDGRIQHGGVVVGLGGIAGHSFLFEEKDSPGYFGQALLARQVSSVTGACLVVRKSVYQEVNGLNAEAFAVAFNDVDFCLKVQSKGYRNVWTPFAELVHHELVSRGADNTPEKIERFARECANFRDRWLGMVENDPFYNPNLTVQTFNYLPAKESRRLKPWFRYL